MFGSVKGFGPVGNYAKEKVETASSNTAKTFNAALIYLPLLS
jgi:hypothetical protein